MGRVRYLDRATHWRTWAGVGGVLSLCWFLLLLAHPYLVLELQSLLLANSGLIPHLPHGIATPRTVVGALASLGLPVMFIALVLSLLFASPRESRRPDRER